MAIYLEPEKIVQLRMWAVDAVAHAASFNTDFHITTEKVLEDAALLVKFVLGE